MHQLFALLTLLHPSVAPCTFPTSVQQSGIKSDIAIVSMVGHLTHKQPLLTGENWYQKGPGHMADITTGDPVFWPDGSPEVGNFYQRDYDDGSMTGPASQQVFMLNLPIGTYGPPTPIKV